MSKVISDLELGVQSDFFQALKFHLPPRRLSVFEITEKSFNATNCMIKVLIFAIALELPFQSTQFLYCFYKSTAPKF